MGVPVPKKQWKNISFWAKTHLVDQKPHQNVGIRKDVHPASGKPCRPPLVNVSYTVGSVVDISDWYTET
jgi:hypothetical protein